MKIVITCDSFTSTNSIAAMLNALQGYVGSFTTKIELVKRENNTTETVITVEKEEYE